MVDDLTGLQMTHESCCALVTCVQVKPIQTKSMLMCADFVPACMPHCLTMGRDRAQGI